MQEQGLFRGVTGIVSAKENSLNANWTNFSTLKPSHFRISFPNGELVHLPNKLLWCFGGLTDWDFLSEESRKPQNLWRFSFIFPFLLPLPFPFFSFPLPLPISSLQERKRAFSCFTQRINQNTSMGNTSPLQWLFFFILQKTQGVYWSLWLVGKPLCTANHSEMGFMQPEEKHKPWQLPAGPTALAAVWHPQWHPAPPRGAHPHPSIPALRGSPHCALSPPTSLESPAPPPAALPCWDSSSHSPWHP